MGIIKRNLINSAVASNRIFYCGSLNLARCQVLTKTTLTTPLATGQG